MDNHEMRNKILIVIMAVVFAIMLTIVFYFFLNPCKGKNNGDSIACRCLATSEWVVRFRPCIIELNSVDSNKR